MFELADSRSSIRDGPNAMPFDPLTMGTDITFHDVHFSYPSTQERSILSGTNCTIQQGQTAAVVGSSGCGKSTILRLLYRFYEPGQGYITVGGRKLTELQTDSLRKAIAVVPQDVVLFNDTIAYNIQYGDLAATMDDVVEAAKQASIHETIMRFPDGYDTIVGERGLKLSGGEKQRVSELEYE